MIDLRNFLTVLSTQIYAIVPIVLYGLPTMGLPPILPPFPQRLAPTGKSSRCSMVHLQNAYPQAAIVPRSFLPVLLPSLCQLASGLLEPIGGIIPPFMSSLLYVPHLYIPHLSSIHSKTDFHPSIHLFFDHKNDSKSDSQVRFTPYFSAPDATIVNKTNLTAR